MTTLNELTVNEVATLAHEIANEVSTPKTDESLLASMKKHQHQKSKKKSKRNNAAPPTASTSNETGNNTVAVITDNVSTDNANLASDVTVTDGTVSTDEVITDLAPSKVTTSDDLFTGPDVEVEYEVGNGPKDNAEENAVEVVFTLRKGPRKPSGRGRGRPAKISDAAFIQAHQNAKDLNELVNAFPELKAMPLSKAKLYCSMRAATMRKEKVALKTFPRGRKATPITSAPAQSAPVME